MKIFEIKIVIKIGKKKAKETPGERLKRMLRRYGY